MKIPTKTRNFFLGITTVFLFNWFGLVVLPWIEVGNLPPIQNRASGTITPWDTSGAAHQGERIYASNGCVYCHTQQVRAATSGSDIIRGWGTATNDDGKKITRRSFPRDYIWQHQVFLGNSRNGADLSNVAERFQDATGLYLYLYDPYIKNAHSSMPAYRFLFSMQRITGQRSMDALDLTDADKPPAGYEVVPTDEARSLVAYLLSLKKDYHLKQDEAGIPYVPPPPSSDN